MTLATVSVIVRPSLATLTFAHQRIHMFAMLFVNRMLIKPTTV